MKTLTADEVIEQIRETLSQADGAYIASIANQILSRPVVYIGDSQFVVAGDKE